MTLSPLQALELDEIQELNFQLPEEEVKQRYKIGDLDSLGWVLRKLNALDAKENEINDHATKELERVHTWKAKESKTIEESRQFFKMLIEEYAREQRANDSKWKASTPYGKVSFRKQQPKWNYDEQKALESVQTSGLDKFIRVKHELDKTALKASVDVREDGSVVDTETGAFIEGVTVTEQPDAVKVEVVD